MSDLRDIWVAASTRTKRHSTSVGEMHLVISTRDGQDAVNALMKSQMTTDGYLAEVATTGDSSQFQLRRRPDLREIDSSSVRIGVDKSDLWRPEHILVWGDNGGNDKIIPIAAEFDVETTLSTDVREGVPSMPVRTQLSSDSTDDAVFQRLLLVLFTKQRSNVSRSKSDLRLRVVAKGQLVVDFGITKDIEDLRMFVIPVDVPFKFDELEDDGISLRIEGDDALILDHFSLWGTPQAQGRPLGLRALAHESNVGRFSSSSVLTQISSDPGEGPDTLTIPKIGS